MPKPSRHVSNPHYIEVLTLAAHYQTDLPAILDPVQMEFLSTVGRVNGNIAQAVREINRNRPGAFPSDHPTYGWRMMYGGPNYSGGIRLNLRRWDVSRDQLYPPGKFQTDYPDEVLPIDALRVNPAGVYAQVPQVAMSESFLQAIGGRRYLVTYTLLSDNLTVAPNE